jgi:CheY-like chemotaxis protein
MTRKLLVIDDDEIGCRLIGAIFSPRGYEVIAARDGGPRDPRYRHHRRHVVR